MNQGISWDRKKYIYVHKYMCARYADMPPFDSEVG